MANLAGKIMVDSSLLLAFVDRADSNHPQATRIMELLSKRGFHLYTSVQNVHETYSTLSREVGVSVALEFLDSVLHSSLEILFPQKTDLLSAYRILRSGRERQLSLREALSVVLMEKRGISQIITFTYWHNLLGTRVSPLATSSLPTF